MVKADNQQRSLKKAEQYDQRADVILDRQIQPLNEAVVLRARALGQRAKVLEPFEPRLIQSFYKIAKTCEQLGYPDAAKILNDMGKNLGLQEDYGVTHFYNIMGGVAAEKSRQKDYPTAEILNRIVIAYAEEKEGKRAPIVVSSLLPLGGSLNRQGKTNEAKQAFSRALEILEAGTLRQPYQSRWPSSEGEWIKPDNTHWDDHYRQDISYLLGQILLKEKNYKAAQSLFEYIWQANQDLLRTLTHFTMIGKLRPTYLALGTIYQKTGQAQKLTDLTKSTRHLGDMERLDASIKREQPEPTTPIATWRFTWKPPFIAWK